MNQDIINEIQNQDYSKITETIEVDPKKWALEYGIALADVRNDVKEYFYSAAQQQVDALGLGAESRDRYQDR